MSKDKIEKRQQYLPFDDEQTHPLETIIEKAKNIIGTKFVYIARLAKTPTQAARFAHNLRLPNEIVKAIRWASIIKRRENKGDIERGTFDREFGPCNEGPERLDYLPETTYLELSIYNPKEGNGGAYVPLNAKEFNLVHRIVLEALKDYKIRVRRNYVKEEEGFFDESMRMYWNVKDE